MSFRLVPLPGIDLPSFSFPDLPGWLHASLKVNPSVAVATVGMFLAGQVALGAYGLENASLGDWDRANESTLC